MYTKEELQTLKRNFWNGFAEYCNSIPRLAAKKEMFILYNTKLKGVELKFDFTNNSVIVAIEFNNRNLESRIAMYEHFVAYKVIFIEEFGNLDCIEWQPFYMLDIKKEVSRIYIEKANLNYLNIQFWNEIYKFMAFNMMQLENVFKTIRQTL